MFPYNILQDIKSGLAPVKWCATRQVDKLNNENFSSPVQFMYRVVYATFSSFCS